jgi:hypothetical protein
MKSFGTTVAALFIGMSALSNSSFACNGGGGGGGGGYVSNGNYGTPGNIVNQACNVNGGVYGNANGGVYANSNGRINGQAYEPIHSNYYVQPGDTFYVISLKEYGTSGPTSYLSQYNRLAPNAALVPGQMLWLPSISANGALSASRAPRALHPNAATTPVLASPASTLRLTQIPVARAEAPATLASYAEPERAKVPTGSTIKLDAQSLGDKPGVVRLKISNVAMPVEVVEWSADSTKVRLPKLDVAGSMNAELEVLRADGTVAATNAISLTTGASGLVAAN